MSNSKIQKIKEELEKIRKNNSGFLNPEDVVKYAKNKKTALHSRFCWDDTEAAHKYRLNQAQHLIRSIKVEIVIDKKKNASVSVRQYASLPLDRGISGYREITEILSEDELRLNFIESVQEEFEQIRHKLSLISNVAEKAGIKISDELKKQKSATIAKIQTGA